MSPLAIASSATSALSSVNIHRHGHKKGLQLDSTDSSPAPGQAASSTQNLFSNIFDSLAQVIGARPAQSAQAALVTHAAHPAQSAQAAQLAIGSTINTTA